MKKTFQNKIAVSRFALPVTAIYALLVWMAAGLFGQHLWIQFTLLAIATYLMVELTNVNSLMRIYSRMVSCAFLALTCASNITFTSVKGAITGVFFIAFYLMFFNAYQDKRASASVFYAFTFLGIVSLVFVHILYLMPLFWILLIVNILAFSGRTFIASILGIIMPYWFLAGYYIYQGNFEGIIDHFAQLEAFGPFFDIQTIISQPHHFITLIFVVVLAITGSVHFLLNAYQDKIRTRMLYELFIATDAVCLFCLLLQPQMYENLLPLLIINTSPLIAHFITFTKSKVSNVIFIIILTAAILLTAYNLWIP